MSLVGNKKIEKVFFGNTKVSSIFVGSNKVYSSAPPIAKCEIRNLGSENPTDVTFTKTDNFPTENEAWEEVTIGNDKFAKFTPWYKKPIVGGTNNDELIGFDIQNGPGEGFVPYDCFLDEDGNLLDYILIGRYCASNTSAINSVNATAANSEILNWRTLARSKGTGYQLMDAAMYVFWRDLALAISEKIDFNAGTAIQSYLGLSMGETSGFGWWIDGLAMSGNGSYFYCNKPSKYTNISASINVDYTEIYQPDVGYYCVKSLGYSMSCPIINLPYKNTRVTTYATYYCDAQNISRVSSPLYVLIGGANAINGLFNIIVSSGWVSVSNKVRLCYRPISA